MSAIFDPRKLKVTKKNDGKVMVEKYPEWMTNKKGLTASGNGGGSGGTGGGIGGSLNIYYKPHTTTNIPIKIVSGGGDYEEVEIPFSKELEKESLFEKVKKIFKRN